MNFIHVMAGALEDTSGRILIARRSVGAHQGGLWEFPGGKLEPGETPRQGLERELAEELGIRLLKSRPLIRIHHDYGDRRVLLDVHRVTAYAGTPVGQEGQPLDWRHPVDMDPADFPAADRPIITALRLPSLYLITGADPLAPPAFLSRLARALDAGVGLVQLRAHGLVDADYARLAEAVFALCESRGARLLLNRHPSGVRGLAAHGLHLASHHLLALRERPSDWALVGASCHGLEELAQATALGLDYALLSPVMPTASHPGVPCLGWEGFAALVELAQLPVYALGGLGTGDLARAIDHGGQGVAAIRGLWPD
jgi:8-oxo-dGTP diphosphatase